MSNANDRGPFVLRAGMPMRTRKEGSRVWQEPIFRGGVPASDDGQVMGELLSGISSSDLHGPMSRVGEWLRRQGASGAGPGLDYEHRPASSYDDGGGGGDLSGTEYADEDVGAADLFGQPATEPRAEYLDEISEYADGDADYFSENDPFENRVSPTVDLEGRSPVRNADRDSLFPRQGSTFARRRFR